MNDDEIQRLAKHLRQANPADDAADDAIPMLTEIVDDMPPLPGAKPSAAADIDLSDPLDLPDPLDALDSLNELDPLDTSEPLDDERIVEQVLERLLGDPSLIGEPVRAAIDAATGRFAEQLAAELHATLACTLRDGLLPTIRAAVDEALAGRPDDSGRHL